jgi:crotonobetainyl-CoA:carnitine CoA-transferase CaiB-like acyl-CoA transferase
LRPGLCTGIGLRRRIRCSDGRWILLLGMESRLHWTKTMRALGLAPGQLPEQWSETSRTVDWWHATALADRVIAQKTYEEWHEVFTAADVWHTPVNR